MTPKSDNSSNRESFDESLATLIALDTLIVIVDPRSAFPQAIHEPMLLPNASIFSRPPSPSLYPTQVS